MRSRRSRYNPGRDLTPEQKAMRYRAHALNVRCEILRQGIGAVITSEDMDPAGYDACREALEEAARCEAESEGLRLVIRAQQDAAEEAESGKVEGQQLQ